MVATLYIGADKYPCTILSPSRAGRFMKIFRNFAVELTTLGSSYEKEPHPYIGFFHSLGFHGFYVLFAKPYIGPKLVY